MAAPVIEFRNDTSPYSTISSISLSGAGFAGSITAGQSSNVVLFRIYNNFANASSIADALNCTLASYDDATHQGSQSTVPVQQMWLQVNVESYNGTLTGADGASYFAIGGFTKHEVPVNGGTIAGTTSNYIQVNIVTVVPATASSTTVSQGIWLEYSYT